VRAVRIAATCGWGLLIASAALAQVPNQDHGVLLVRRGTAAIGREEFTIARIQAPGGGTAVTISSINRYPPTPARRTFVRFGPRRLTVRLETPSTEVAREYPAGASLVADDSVFAVYAMAASTPTGQIRLYYPRSGERGVARLHDRGMAETSIGEGQRTLHHLVIDRGGNGEIHLWFDPEGRLMKVGLPSQQLVAEREI